MRSGYRLEFVTWAGREDQLAEFAEKAFSIKRLMVLTPRPVSEADILAIYREAL